MRRDWWWQGAVLCVLFLVSFLIYRHVAAESFAPCSVGEFKPEQKSTITSLDAIIDLSLKLSTALVGFGAAAIIGLKSGLRLSSLMKLSLAVAIIFFAESALYAVWWRIGLAEVFYNECFKIVVSPKLQLRFEWHIYFFMLGLAAIGLLVVEALLRSPTKEADT